MDDKTRIRIWIVIFVVLIAGYVIGRIHNLERSGGGILAYCINLEWEHHTLREGWIECEMELDNTEREISTGIQMYQACEDTASSILESYQELEQQLELCEMALIED